MSFKRVFYNILIIFIGLMLMGGCPPKPDKNIPEITLNGDNPLTVSLGTAYKELGATATDKEDGEVPVTISGTVDTSKVGEYIITYTAVDSDGHKVTKERTVRVIVNKFGFLNISLEKTIVKPNEKVYFDFTIEKNISNFEEIKLFTYISSDSKIDENEFEKNIIYGINKYNFKGNKFRDNDYIKIITPKKKGKYYTGICIKKIIMDSKNTEYVNICSNSIEIEVIDDYKDDNSTFPLLDINSPKVDKDIFKPKERFSIKYKLLLKNNTFPDGGSVYSYISTDSNISKKDDKRAREIGSAIYRYRLEDDKEDLGVVYGISPEKEGTYYVGACIENIEYNGTIYKDFDICTNGVKIEVKEENTSQGNSLKSISIPEDKIFIRKNLTKEIDVIGYYDNNSSKNINTEVEYKVENENIISINNGEITALQEGNTTFKAVSNGIESNVVYVIVTKELDEDKIIKNSLFDQYKNLIPADALPDAYSSDKFAIITGKITNKSKEPIEEATVKILNHSEFGSVTTDENGKFEIPIEGGTTYTVVYLKNGYLPVHREVDVPVQNWANIEVAQMSQVDTKVTNINLSGGKTQIHTASKIVDERGERETTLVFDGVSSATVKQKNGKIMKLTNLKVRATEYNTPESMPAKLPEGTAFTYCTALTVDGVDSESDITFDKPVTVYIDNFLGFKVGEIVPVGYYNRKTGEWEAYENGVVVKLLDSNNDGKIDGLDSDGDDIADDLNGDGDTTDEVAGIKDNSNYSAGKTYSRFQIPHFSDYDPNYGSGIKQSQKDKELEDKREVNATQRVDDKHSNCLPSDSYINIQNQIYHEDIPINGTNLTLHYSSERVKGYKHIVSSKVSGEEIPDSLIEIIAKFEIAGRTFTKTLPSEPNQEVEFFWDGLDSDGKRVQGTITGKLSVGYKYEAYYLKPPSMQKSFGQSSEDFTDVKANPEIKWKTDIVTFNNPIENQEIANGWNLSNHNFYSKGVISKGNGGKLDKKLINGKGLTYKYFGVTLLEYSTDTNKTKIINNIFGSDYREADWNDIKEFYNNGGDLEKLFKSLDMTSAFVTRDGYEKWGSRYYFITFHNHNKPSYYLAHDNIDNYLVSLGSWYSPKKILVIQKEKKEDYTISATKVLDYSQTYIFDIDGKHLKTIDTYTQKTLTTFEYDKNDRFIKIKDQFNNTIKIVRDTDGKPTQIVAPNGQITYLNIDENNNLTTISYEDNSNYKFEYDEGSLMLKEIEPNGNSFEHIFDDNGRVVKVLDELGGIKEYVKNSFFYNIKTALGNIQTIVMNGINQETTTPSGKKITTTYQDDGMTKIVKSCGIETTTEYKKDEVSGDDVVKKETIKLPSGKSLSVEIDRTYTYKEDNSTKTITIKETTNGKTTTTISDYENGITTATSPMGRVAKTYFNTDNLLPTKVEVANLEPTLYEYDSKGRVIETKTGDRVESISYDERGNIASITDANGKTTTMEYDLMGRVTKLTTPSNAVVYYSYDKNGNMTILTTPNENDHKFTYNKVNKNTSYISATSKLTKYEYDLERKLKKITYPSGKTKEYIYNKTLLSSIQTDEGTTNFEYDCLENLTKATYGSESIEYAYDGSLLTKIKYSGLVSKDIEFEYNSDFQLSKISYANSSEDLTYDKDGLLTKKGLFSISRDTQNGLPLSVDDGTLQIQREYSRYGELNKKEDSVGGDNFYSYELQRDSVGKITQKIENIAGESHTYTYSYNSDDRLIEVKKDGAVIESYSYDKNGNRVGSSVNEDDQLLTYKGITYSYDNDGYLKSKKDDTGTTTYEYGINGELKKVTLSNGKVIEYLHNANHQRVAKKIDGEIVEKYLWLDLTTLFATYDKDNNLIARFEYADSRVPIAMQKNGKRYYLHYDQVGTLKLITDESGNSVKKIEYDSYGNILSDSNPDFKVPFGFAGGIYDSDTKLTRFGYRDYDSFSGRWTAKDPILFNGGDTNLYGYVLGDPVNFVDSEGKFWTVILGGAYSFITSVYNNWNKSGAEFVYRVSVDTLGGMVGGFGKKFLTGIAYSLAGTTISIGGNELMNETQRRMGVSNGYSCNISRELSRSAYSSGLQGNLFLNITGRTGSLKEALMYIGVSEIMGKLYDSVFPSEESFNWEE